MIFNWGKKKPVIKDVMTPTPITVTPNTHLVTVKRSMSQHKIRHIPIVEKGELLGILSERDLGHAEVIFKDRKMEEVRVSDLLYREAYFVYEDASLSDVLKYLIKNKVGSTVVLNQGKHVTGIFTTHDACKLLLDTLR